VIHRPVPRWIAFAVVGLASVLLAWSRLANLQVSFWQDEAATALQYIDPGPAGVFRYYSPNDHVLYTLLSWVTVKTLGHVEAIYRFWSVIPGLASIGVVTVWAWRRFGPAAASATVVLAAVSPVHLVLTPQARGYGLAMFAAAVMLVSAVRVSDRGSARDVALFGVAGFAGIATLPVFAPAFVGHVVVLLVRRERRIMAAVVTGAVIAASLLLYSPILGDVLDSSEQEFGARLAWSGPITGPFDALLRPTLRTLVPARFDHLANRLIIGLVCVVLIGLATRKLWRSAQRTTWAHLVVPVVGTYGVLTIGRFFVAERFASFLLPYVVVLLALGAVEAWHLARRLLPTAWLATLVAIVVAVPFALVGTRHVVQHVNLLARFPYENTKQVGLIANNVDADAIITNSRRPEGLLYYVGDELRVVEDQDVLDDAICTRPAPFVFIDHQSPRFHPEPDLRCLADRGAVRVRVPQQRSSAVGNRGVYEVWLVPAR
jgi:hypothetical protein